MENKTPAYITDSEFDMLMKEAFLDTDFEGNSHNKTALDLVANHTLQHNNLVQIYTSYRLEVLFLIISFFICLNSFYRYIYLSTAPESRSAPVANTRNLERETPVSFQAVICDTSEELRSVAGKGFILTTNTSHHHQKGNFSANRKKELPVFAESDTMDKTHPASIDNSIEIRPDNVLKVLATDSVRPITPPTAPPDQTVASTRKNSTVMKSIGPQNSINYKKAKKRKKSVFHRNGTFMLKGGKYMKSGRI